ncbi:hypothetical protein SAMN02745975_01123 [Geosporobacter subterraneus DSM 17957]|uniref:Uncharacterized protein n=1 Tax=Geosporobacter subterraneus DSM 17957 TaxID=1121919 RepID=A0A1M6FX67_9FIRM|nr:hypothetical protein [Geosporobacter subterraneus]SHJ02267.1 hypothetical protein SAMN02745975_01123 [Geosporobacter subterraneus DSM 17957]
MKAMNNGKDSILMRLFIGCIISFIIILLMLNNQSSLVRHLETETYYKLQTSIERLKEQPELMNQELSRIIAEHQQKKEEIQKTTISNSIKGFLITIAIILATVSNIIKNFKSIVKELLGKNYSEEECKSREDCLDQRRECLIPMPTDKNWYMSKEIRQLLEQINLMEENKLSQEMQQLIQQAITLLVGQLVQLSKQTSNFTKQLSHDRENLTYGISEMKKGIEQVTQAITRKNRENAAFEDEEMFAAMEQINSVIEEIGELLVGMEERIHDLTQRIEHDE